MRPLIARSLLLVGALQPAVAAAHADIDEARAHYELAEFTEALAALSRAEESEALTDEELHELLALRATIHFATRAEDAFHNALRTLASVAPSYRFDPGLPPLFLEAWEQARDAADPLRVRVVVLEEPLGPRFRAHVEGSAAGLVRRAPLLYARPPGERWRRGRGGVIALHDPDVQAVEYYAEALGPGGVVVAREGTADNPRITRLAALDVEAAQAPPETDWVPWMVAGAAGVVAVGLAIALGVVAGGADPHTTVVRPPSFPMPE